MSTFSGDTGVISNNCWYYWTHPRDTDMHYSSCSLWHPSHLSILFKLDPSYPYSSGSKEVTMGNNPSRWWHDIKMAKTYSLNSFWYNFADNNGWADWSSVCSTASLVENKPLCSLLCSLFRVTKKYCFPAWIASERQSIKHKTKSRKCYFKCWLETEIKGFLCFLQRVFEAKKNNDANDKIVYDGDRWCENCFKRLFSFTLRKHQSPSISLESQMSAWKVCLSHVYERYLK